LTFSDGTEVWIEAMYGGYTGQSIGEYPVWMVMTNCIDDLEEDEMDYGKLKISDKS